MSCHPLRASSTFLPRCEPAISRESRLSGSLGPKFHILMTRGVEYHILVCSVGCSICPPSLRTILAFVAETWNHGATMKTCTSDPLRTSLFVVKVVSYNPLSRHITNLLFLHPPPYPSTFFCPSSCRSRHRSHRRRNHLVLPCHWRYHHRRVYCLRSLGEAVRSNNHWCSHLRRHQVPYWCYFRMR